MTNTNDNSRQAWPELATAAMHLTNLVNQQDRIIEGTTEAMSHCQRDLVKRINRTFADPNWPAEPANAVEIERTNRMMAEYQADIATHTALRDAYKVAAAIIEAVSGAYFYAAYEGYYRTEIMKFATEERRDAWLEETNGWHAATNEDMNEIFWGNAIPKEEPKEF